MGRGCVSGPRVSSREVAWIAFGPASGRICHRISAGRGSLLLYLPALGLAGDVFHWRIACAALLIHTRQGERAGGMASAPHRLAQLLAHDPEPLAAVPLSRPADDVHDWRLSRHTGHVSDLPQEAASFQRAVDLRDHHCLYDWGHCWRTGDGSIL